MAKKLKISRPRISQLVGEGRIPRKAEYTMEDVKAARAMLKEARAGNNATAALADEPDDDSAIAELTRNPEKQHRIKIMIQREVNLRLKNGVLSGGLIDKEEAERQRVGRVFSVRAKLQEFPLRASLIAMKSEAECEKILEDWARELCDYYATGGN